MVIKKRLKRGEKNADRRGNTGKNTGISTP
jgi:hypothetical protein